MRPIYHGNMFRPVGEPYVTIVPAAIQSNAMHNWEFRTESHQAQVALGTEWCAYCGGHSAQGTRPRPGCKLRCEFGRLQKIYPTSTLASVSSAIQKEIADLISLSESGDEITLTHSASKASTSNTAYVSCKCKESCDLRKWTGVFHLSSQR